MTNNYFILQLYSKQFNNDTEIPDKGDPQRQNTDDHWKPLIEHPGNN